MKPKMTVDEALAFADEWVKVTNPAYLAFEGWRVVCAVLAEEVRKNRRGEFICSRCGIRKDGEHTTKGDF